MILSRASKFIAVSMLLFTFSLSLDMISPLFHKQARSQSGMVTQTAQPLPKRLQGGLWKASLRTGETGSGIGLAMKPASVSFLPEGFTTFIDQVRNGDEYTVRGLFVADVLALEVVQQPENDSIYVSTRMSEATEFRNARRNGVIGLLAHNYLSGIEFYEIEEGQELWIVYGSGKVQRYRVTAIDQYQKLTPESVRSEFLDLSDGDRLNTAQVFNAHYQGENKVILQTCLERDGISNWGLTFWTAVPIN